MPRIAPAPYHSNENRISRVRQRYANASKVWSAKPGEIPRNDNVLMSNHDISSAVEDVIAAADREAEEIRRHMKALNDNENSKFRQGLLLMVSEKLRRKIFSAHQLKKRIIIRNLKI